MDTKKIEQLNDNLGAVGVVLSSEELQSLDKASALLAEYPGWMIEMWSGARQKQLAKARSQKPAKKENHEQ